MFKNLSSVSYTVTDLKKAEQWYTKLLTFEPVFESPFVVIYSVGGSSLTLLKKDSDNETDSAATIYWEVESISDSFDQLIQMGAERVSPVQTVMNSVQAKLKDPFGNILGICCSQADPEQRGVEKELSETAMLLTFCRALSACDERNEMAGDDTLAHHFLSPQYKKAFQNSESQQWAKEKLRGIYGYAIARTAYGDTLFRAALKNSTPQIVILGAGYDTRSYRYCNPVDKTVVFEVDAAATQNRKREQLGEFDIPIPSSLKFIPMNFKTDSLLESLDECGYDVSLKTLFLWEGVTQYLPEKTVRETVQFIENHSGVGSTIFFDYLTEERSSTVESEPFLFWTDPDTLSDNLQKHSISTVEMLNCSDIEELFLHSSSSSQGEKSVPYFSFFYGEKM